MICQCAAACHMQTRTAKPWFLRGPAGGFVTGRGSGRDCDWDGGVLVTRFSGHPSRLRTSIISADLSNSLLGTQRRQCCGGGANVTAVQVPPRRQPERCDGTSVGAVPVRQCQCRGAQGSACAGVTARRQRHCRGGPYRCSQEVMIPSCSIT